MLGGGAVVLGVGGLVEFQASQDMSSYDHQLALVCADTGCGPGRPIPQNVADEQQQAKRENAIAIGVMSVGIAAAAVGGALLYLNRGLPVYPSIEHTAGGAAVSLSGRF